MRRLDRLALGLVLVSAFALAPLRARALGITPDPLNWDLSGQGAITTLLGSVDFLGVITGLPAGGVVFSGAVGPSDITLVFQHSLDPSSEFGLPDLFAVPGGTAVMTASGAIPGPDADVLSGSSVGRWTFTGVEGFDPGTTLDPIFVSFSTLSPGDTIGWEFVVILMGTQTVTAAPEPGVALLLLAGLGLASRLRRRREGVARVVA